MKHVVLRTGVNAGVIGLAALMAMACGSNLKKPAGVVGPEADAIVGTPDEGPPDGGGVEDADGGDAGKDAPLGEADGGGGSDASDVGAEVPQRLCDEDRCEIAGACYDNEQANPDNACEICLVLVERAAWTFDDAGACDDGDPCTDDDYCLDGVCTGWPVACDDANPCTEDFCDPTEGCAAIPNGATCDDGDPCTIGDLCAGGACVPGGDAPDCDDGNPCTTDSCDPAAGGCVNLPADGVPCADGSICTDGDTCAGGACVPGPALDCDDTDLCTIDKCHPVDGCQHESIAALCADANPCTDETCDPIQGCIYPFNTVGCDDEDACTEDDTCTDGACIGAQVDIDDGNLCTDDYCDSATGEYHEFNSVPCVNENLCSLGDFCDQGSCADGPDAPDCDDGNVCTDDTCEAAVGCVNTNHARRCDDADACTEDDICGEGTCTGTTVVCEDDNACTENLCITATGCDFPLIISNACRPTIVVDYPPRAATIADSLPPDVVVTGHVTSGAGPITTFTLDGVDVGVDPATGAFSHVFHGRVGANVLEFFAEDSFGSQKNRVQAYHWSTHFFKADAAVPGTGMVDPGMAIWLGQETIDDGDHSLPADDLATIFEIVLGTMDLNSMIPSPATTMDSLGHRYALYIQNLTYNAPSVSLVATDGGLHMDAVIANVSGGLLADRTKCPQACLPWPLDDVCTDACILPDNVTGSISMSSIAISADIGLSANAAHDLEVELLASDVQINGLDVSLDGVLGFLINWIVDIFIPGFVSDIEAQFNDAIQDEIVPLLESALSALAFNMSFDLPRLDGVGTIPVSLESDFSSTGFYANEGGYLALRARATTPGRGVPAGDPFASNLGVPARTGCGVADQFLVIPGFAPMEVIFADDTLNEILYAAWWGGLLEFDVGPELLGDFDLGQYGITDLTMHISALLPPLASDCGAAGDLRLYVGDMMVTADMNLLGQQMSMVAYVSLNAGIGLSAEDGQIAITVTTIDPDQVQMEINILQESLIESEAALAGLIKDNLVPAIEGMLGGGEPLASFPLPEIDLSDSLGLPPGTVMIAIATLSNPAWDPRMDGNTIVYGRLK